MMSEYITYIVLSWSKIILVIIYVSVLDRHQ